ncbi:hypothetical protein VAS14_18714 [Photobacterium angustum S14]|uniref:Uncharacterized protein n=1 Tax=Photobacterium angustum (strain S14 / CCUG 15956) TaxID=314292 RepID=Q1ZKF1_PHOAS|nr:hypothetical protein VAS14_18714 [Photobacterium angustum S14]
MKKISANLFLLLLLRDPLHETLQLIAA